MALVAGAPHALFQRLAEFAEAAAFVAMGEILGEIAEAYRIDEARQLDIGALDETPKAGDSADAEQAGEQPRRAETFEAERPDEQERRQQQQRRSEERHVGKACVSSVDRGGRGIIKKNKKK